MLHRKIESALAVAAGQVLAGSTVPHLPVKPCADPRHGDYQSNALMTLAKERKMNPRQLATDIAAKLDVSAWCDKVEIAGAGFLNFRVKPEAIAACLSEALQGQHLFFTRTTTPQTIVVDFSSPNVAKPMHVGHIRSTFLGDSISRILTLLGHKVIRDNHIGDWGTQFGKLIVGWKKHLDADALQRDPLGEMERLYKLVNGLSEAAPAVLELARQELVKLQAGDSENLEIWKKMIDLSQVQFDTIYGRLGVRFDYALGESFYNPQLKQVVQDLQAKEIARDSEGAICVFSDGSLPPKEDPFLIQRDGEWHPNPALIQKSDGAANYATTDMATLLYRWETWQPSLVVYVTDGRQQLHFRQIFNIWQRWHPELAEKMKLTHVWFGSILVEILDENGVVIKREPFKTRSGDTVKLADLLDEAVERAFAVVREKNAELPESDCREIARVVGLGAVKYADLLPNRQSDYVFSWDKMLSLQGNTAPYLQYAYARARSIFRKLNAGESCDPKMTLQLKDPAELGLAKQLMSFGITLEAVGEEHRPNFLCNYLYDLAGHFARFYEQCPVLKAEGAERATRIALCELTSRVLKQGLELLGIEVLEQM